MPWNTTSADDASTNDASTWVEGVIIYDSDSTNAEGWGYLEQAIAILSSLDRIYEKSR